MELFKKIAEVLSLGEDLTIVVKPVAGGKMTVSVMTGNSSVKDDAKNYIAPLIVKGTPDELDKGFVDAIIQPVETSVGLHTSMKEFEDSAKTAGDKSKAAAAAKTEAKAETDTKKPTAKPSKTSKSKSKAAPEPEPAPEPSMFDGTEEDGGDNGNAVPAEEAVAESAAETVSEAVEEAADNGQEAAEETAVQNEPQAPEAADVIKKDINTLWHEGKDKYVHGNYAAAKELFEQCRGLANPLQYEQIDKAIASCNAKLNATLFGQQNQ